MDNVQVGVEDVTSRLDPRPDPSFDPRIETLIADAYQQIRVAFLREGRDFDQEVDQSEWLGDAAQIVVREMVSAAILIGPNAGIRSVSSTTGPQSDSITYANVDAVRFGGVALTDLLRRELGLPVGGYARGRFPLSRRWPEVIHRG